LEGSKFS